MSADAQSLLKDAEMSAERSVAFVRCAISIAVSIFFFGIAVPTFAADSPALDLKVYFAVFSTGYFLFSIATFVLARATLFRSWMPWLFTTLDLCFWCGLLVATVTIIRLPVNYVIVVPPALMVFIILSLVALRNNPWLQAYAVSFVLVAFVSLFIAAPVPVAPSAEDPDLQVDFFGLPLNSVRLSMVALTGLILLYLAIRTRRLLHRAIRETVQRTNLSRYLPPQLSDRLARIDQDRLLSGSLQEAAVIFVDIRGFTALAENMDPDTLHGFLTDYRQIVSAQVHAHGGIVDKYVGDSVMAVFGAPDASGHDAANALDCATAIVAAIAAWNVARHQRQETDIAVGVGAHWGQVFCGAVGDHNRLEFTVLGDTVNVAARLEQLTKEVGVPAIASQTLFAEAGVQPAAGNGWVRVADPQLRGRKGHLELFAYA